MAFSYRYLHQDSTFPVTPHTSQLPPSLHPFWFYHLNNICLRLKIMNFLIMHFYPDFYYFLRLGINRLPNSLPPNSLRPCPSLSAGDQVSHLHKTTCRILLLCILDWYAYTEIKRTPKFLPGGKSCQLPRFFGFNIGTCQCYSATNSSSVIGSNFCAHKWKF